MPTLIPDAWRAQRCAAYPINARCACAFERVTLVLAALTTRVMFFVTELQAEADSLILSGSRFSREADAWIVWRLSHFESVRLPNLHAQRAAIQPDAHTMRDLFGRGAL